MKDKLDKLFKPVVALNNDRFSIWKILTSHKSDDILVTFNSIDEKKKYACLSFDKLLKLLYDKSE